MARWSRGPNGRVKGHSGDRAQGDRARPKEDVQDLAWAFPCAASASRCTASDNSQVRSCSRSSSAALHARLTARWRRPRGCTTIMTREAGPRCPRCGTRGGDGAGAVFASIQRGGVAPTNWRLVLAPRRLKTVLRKLREEKGWSQAQLAACRVTELLE